jgi:hypothetical protein
MKFLKTSALFLQNVLMLLVLLPIEWLRLMFSGVRQPVKVRR